MSEYVHAAHVAAVLRASKARCSARAVLLEMCRRSDFDRPECEVFKASFAEFLGYTRRTVQYALTELRAEGSIVPLAHVGGGRGRPVRYRLVVVGQGGSSSPAEPVGQGKQREPTKAELKELSKRTKRDGYGAAHAWLKDQLAKPA